MKSHNSVSVLAGGKSRSCICSSFFITMALIFGAYFIATAFIQRNSFMLSTGLRPNIEQQSHSVKCEISSMMDNGQNKQQPEKCNVYILLTSICRYSFVTVYVFVFKEEKCRPIGSESLPKGIISATSNLEMYPLSGPDVSNDKPRPNLLALPVGLHQKGVVNQIVKKFLGEEFAVMLFHYDGFVDGWHHFEWSHRVIHVSATNQTKWWFAKRFLHPDIVAQYDYIFLWDEDLGLDNFRPARYLSIIKEEGLEISQPALDPAKSQLHHQITVRNRRSRVHRRYYRLKDGGSGRCDGNSSAPPCVGWVEMMAPVFSRAAWRCVWHMIQNDLIHAWGLDKQLGYCAQGDRTTKVGVVDEEYVVHLGLPTLGSLSDNNKVKSGLDRSAVRARSYAEMMSFRNRWDKAVEEDQCWVDAFTTTHH